MLLYYLLLNLQKVGSIQHYTLNNNCFVKYIKKTLAILLNVFFKIEWIDPLSTCVTYRHIVTKKLSENVNKRAVMGLDRSPEPYSNERDMMVLITLT